MTRSLVRSSDPRQGVDQFKEGRDKVVHCQGQPELSADADEEPAGHLEGGGNLADKRGGDEEHVSAGQVARDPEEHDGVEQGDDEGWCH